MNDEFFGEPSNEVCGYPLTKYLITPAYSVVRGDLMPIFIDNEEKFIEIAKRAIECRVKRLEKRGIAKIKARTKRYLYTYIIELSKLDDFLKKLPCKAIKEV